MICKKKSTFDSSDIWCLGYLSDRLLYQPIHDSHYLIKQHPPRDRQKDVEQPLTSSSISDSTTNTSTSHTEGCSTAEMQLVRSPLLVFMPHSEHGSSVTGFLLSPQEVFFSDKKNFSQINMSLELLMYHFIQPPLLY